MSKNTATVETYLDGFRRNDHAQILSCLTDDVVRMVDQDDVVMAELTDEVTRDTGEVMHMSMAEVFVLRDGKIAERRAWVVPLTENDYR
ncbi:MAG: nuclear transport factor 2 family protein [Blastococcus sp.]|nr:nuclear transport factor 2 family protein [Blastococcus sp.]